MTSRPFTIDPALKATLDGLIGAFEDAIALAAAAAQGQGARADPILIGALERLATRAGTAAHEQLVGIAIAAGLPLDIAPGLGATAGDLRRARATLRLLRGLPADEEEPEPVEDGAAPPPAPPSSSPAAATLADPRLNGHASSEKPP